MCMSQPAAKSMSRSPVRGPRACAPDKTPWHSSRGGEQGGTQMAEDGIMPLQNRVLPTGEIIADPARGLMMGNRGCLHGPGRELGVSRWRAEAGVCLVLDLNVVRRD